MVWSHLLYDKLFSNNICMLIIDLLYVTQFLNNIYVAFVVPDTGSSRKSRNMFICFLQETLTHVIDRHDIQLDSVQRDLGIMTPDMTQFGYNDSRHDHVSTASSRPGETHCHSQSSLYSQSLQLGMQVWQAVLILPQPTQRDKIGVSQLFTQ